MAEVEIEIGTFDGLRRRGTVKVDGVEMPANHIEITLDVGAHPVVVMRLVPKNLRIKLADAAVSYTQAEPKVIEENPWPCSPPKSSPAPAPA